MTTSMPVRLARVPVAVLAAALAFAACSAPAPVLTPAKIETFDVTPNPVAAGADVTVHWKVSGDIVGIELFAGGASFSQSADAEGTATIAKVPAGSLDVSLVVTAKDGTNPRADKTVEAVTKPTIGTFAADRLAVAAGSGVALTWATAVADKVTITTKTGANLGEKTGAEAAAGGLLVKPVETTEYVLTATGVGGTDTKSLTITVLPAPAFAKLELAPTRVLAGNPLTLTWETSHATSLVVQTAGRNIYTAPADAVASGSRTFTFDATTTLTVIIEGSGGTLTKDVEASIIPPVRVARFSADPPDVITGSDVTLSWEVTGADTVQLTANGGVVDLGELAGPNSAVTLTPTQTTVYELLATGEGGSATATVTVNAYSVPLIDSFDTDRAVVFRNREPAVLSWVTHSGTELSIADQAGNLVDTSGQPVDAGHVAVEPPVDSIYTLTLVGPGGAVQSAPLAVQVKDPVPAVQFTSNKPQVLKGETLQLQWTVTDHTSMTITAKTGNGSPVALDLGGAQTVPPPNSTRASDTFTTGAMDDTTVFTLTATGPGGTETKSITVVVVKLPAFTTFTSNKLVHDDVSGTDQIIVTKGKQFDLTWVTTDATAVAFEPSRGLAQDRAPFTSIGGQPGTQSITLIPLSTTFGPQDEGYADITFPNNFAYPFFGASYTGLRFSADGYVCFGGDNECGPATSVYGGNSNIPSTSKPNNYIAPFWDDLDGGGNGAYYYRIDGTAPNRKMTFEWQTDVYSSSENGTKLIFQAVLFESGDWEIRHAPRATATTNIAGSGKFGSSATIGIEGPGGAAGTLGSYNDANGLCAGWAAGSGSTPPTCNQYTRLMPMRLAPSGSQTLTATKDELIHMVATGPVGSAPSPSLALHVVDPAVVNSFSANKTFIGAGESVVLTYDVGPNAAAVKTKRITDGTNDLPPLGPLSGTVTVSPTATTTYTLEVANTAGDKDTKAITIKVEKPTATLVVDRTSLPSGESVKFTWTSSGATGLVVKAPDGTIIAGPYNVATDAATVASGNKTVAVTQSGDYRVEATNGSGTTTVPVTLDVPSDLRILSFTSAQTEQTAGETAVLSWETFNASQVSIQVEGEAQPLPGMPITDPTQVRNGSFPAPVRSTDTKYVITATAKTGGGTTTKSVTVASVAPAQINTLTLSAPAVSWNEQVTVNWTTTNATSVHLYQVTATGANPPNGPEVPDAVDRTTGSATLRLGRTTAFRLVVTNRLGTQVSQLSSYVVVSVSTPTMTLTASPGNGVPNGGTLQLGWNSTQAERVYLFGSDSQPAPNGFVEISGTGTELIMKSSGTGSANFDTGYATMTLPSDFKPTFFGDTITTITATADGVIGLGSATTTAYCGVSSSCSGIGTLPSSTYKGVISLFSRDLSGCFGTSTASGCTTRGRAPGKVFTEVKGTAPNRYLVVEWFDWDFYSSSSKGSLNFEAKIYETGIVELQYGTMTSASTSAFTGTGGIGLQNTASTVAFNMNIRPINTGDGYRYDTATGTPQLPYDFVPFDFVDISQTGTAQTLQSGSTANYDSGSVTVNFPAGFSPIYFGEAMTGAVVQADGVLALSSTGTYSCTGSCSSVGQLPSSTYKSIVAPFNADLSACFGSSAASTCTTRGRAPGKVFTELRGTAPNRVFIAQWNDWDYYSSSSAGSLTFEVKVYENGDTEIQYKNLDSKSPLAAKGSGANVGLQNTAGNIGLTLSTGTTTLFKPVNPGDGYRFYSGNQPLSGSIRTFFTLPSGSTKVTYRGTAINSIAPGGVTDSKAVPLVAGANDILISELMIDPVDGADDDKEWIELRNRKTVAVPLAGYTIETSSGSFTFQGGQIPAATTTSDGYLVIGMNQDPAANGGAPVQLAYGNAVKMNDTSDSVVLRYGNVLVDRVEYDTAAGWRIPRAQSLMGDAFVTTGVGNDAPSFWCAGRGAAGAKSSPGQTNGQCYGFTVVPYNGAYDLEAITPALTAVQVEGDEAYVNNLPIGFSFPHFGNAYSTVAVSTNGWLAFNTVSSSTAGNAALPSGSVSSRLDGMYPLWDDLTYISGRTVGGVTKKSSIYTATLGTAPNRKFVVHWAGYKFYYGGSTGNSADFMAVLGEDGSIEFHYKSVGDSTYGNASGATIGVEALGSSYGVQYGYNQAVLPPAGAPAQYGLRLSQTP